ncbi:MAG: sigma-70 family RNA polymerase sigma factor [Akkermansiaceae bacterium]|nr:sigma-70 family RNA polymerase sigma factor [Verrucomicrobiales bacterium]
MNPETPDIGGSPDETGIRSQDGRFIATSWTAVMAAGQPEAPQAQEALARLCEAYWQPLHDYVRRLGHSETDAKDLTQEFFLRVLSKNILAAADRDKGRFRTFLLTALNHFLANEWHRANAVKRGGGKVTVSIDEETEDEQPRHEPATELSPETIYQRSWAASVFRQAHERLGEEYESAGKTRLFEQLKAFLEGSPDPRGYHAVAAALSMTPNAVGVAVHRMRQRLGQLIRAEVERTLVNPTATDIDGEMRFLLETLGR